MHALARTFGSITSFTCSQDRLHLVISRRFNDQPLDPIVLLEVNLGIDVILNVSDFFGREHFAGLLRPRKLIHRMLLNQAFRQLRVPYDQVPNGLSHCVSQYGACPWVGRGMILDEVACRRCRPFLLH